MAFTPSAFYSVANELLTKSAQDGGHLRTLISRAYYGALIVARDAKSIPTQGERGHQRVIDAYKGNDAAEDLVSDSLHKLRKLRERADYQPKDDLSRNDGLAALSHSRKVLQALNSMPPTSASAASTATP